MLHHVSAHYGKMKSQKLLLRLNLDSYKDLKKNSDRVSLERYKVRKRLKNLFGIRELKFINTCNRSWTPKRLKMIYT